MRSLTLDELRELAPGYVMGTLSADELTFFHASLTDPTIAAQLAPEIAAHRAAMEFLATDHAVTPPPTLKSRLSERIAAERIAAERIAAERIASVVEPPAAPAAPALSVLRGAPEGTPDTRRASTAPWILSGVMALAAAASVVFAVSQQRALRDTQDLLRGEQLVTKNQAQRLASRDSTVNTLTHAETNLVLVTLAPTDAKAHTLQVFWNRRTGEAVLHASAFDQVASDRTYCLWIIRNGKPESVALFTPDADGHRLLNGVKLPLDLKGISAMAVTEEPAAGSPQPTMQPFLVGAVTAAP